MPSAGVKPVAPKAAPKPRLVSGRKPAGKTGGLGVKKMSKQVDQSLFDQTPEEQAPTPATVSLILHAARLCRNYQDLVPAYSDSYSI